MSPFDDPSGSQLDPQERALALRYLAETQYRLFNIIEADKRQDYTRVGAYAHTIKNTIGSYDMGGTREMATGLHRACVKGNHHEAHFLVQSLGRILKLESERLSRKYLGRAWHPDADQ